MRSDTTVRRADLASDADALAVVQMIDAYARDRMGGGAGLSPEVRQATLAGLREHPASVVFLALAGEEPAGVAVCFRNFSTFAGRPSLNIHDLAVHPDHRRLGLGLALLRAARQFAEEIGCSRVTLEVRHDNADAQRLYQRVGFGPCDPPMAFWSLSLP